MESFSLKGRRFSLERAKVAKCEERLLNLQPTDRPFMTSAEFIIEVKVNYRVTLVLALLLHE